MFWLATARMLLRPMPPIPTHATLRRSDGGVNPRPSTWRGTTATAAPVTAAVSMNWRRETPGVFLLSSMPSPFDVGHDIPSGHDTDNRAAASCPRLTAGRAESGAVEIALRRQEP